MLLEIVARSEGNPLFAEELLREALDASGETLPLPPTVQAAALDRLGRLSALHRKLIVLASAAGRRFSPEILATVAERPMEEVLAALDEAVALQLLEAERGPLCAFRHALICDAIYGELMSSERRSLHARFLGALEKLPARAQNAEELARHAWEAGEFAKVIRYAMQAAHSAMGFGAYEDAARLVRSALAAGPEPSALAQMQTLLAEALYAAGDARGAIAAVEPAIEFYRSTGASAAEAQALLAARHYYHDEAVAIDRGVEAAARARAARTGSRTRARGAVRREGRPRRIDASSSAGARRDAGAGASGGADRVRSEQ